MLVAMTSTCLRDRDCVLRLGEQLRARGVDHYLFVEESEIGHFDNGPVDRSRVLSKPDGGGNGLGKDGSVVRWHCHQQMLSRVTADDTLIQVDSDVYFVDDQIIDDLVCGPHEIRGYGSDADGLVYVEAGRLRFVAFSGMLVAVSGQVFLDAMNISLDELVDLCDMLDRHGTCPSEDIVASCLYQSRGGATTVVDFSNRHRRALDGQYFDGCAVLHCSKRGWEGV